MKKYIPLVFFILIAIFSTSASNISKPISAQYGFIENKGQIIDQNNKPNPQVLYLYNGNGLHVQLRQDGFSYEVMNMVKTPKAVIDIIPISKFASQADSFDITYQIHRVDINFKGGNKNAVLKPYEPANDYINYYTTATPEEGITHVQHFQKVVYENVYPNIDIEFVLNDAANKGKFKYNFIVKPHANLADIQLEFVGANRTSLTKEGNILIQTAYGNLEENIPLSYVINKDNSHSTIKASFISLANNVFGINAEDYNHNQTLVIDPTNWATYYGGNDDDFSTGVAIDVGGNVFITGYTFSTGAIATNGTHQIIHGGGTYDVFIAKFNTNGVRQWGTYYGGGGDDFGNGITIDTSGAILVTGSTKSIYSIVTSTAHQTIFGGGASHDAFIAKFDSNGVRQWATYYGSNVNDKGEGITTDSGGNIIITGVTGSINAIATIGAHQVAYSNAGTDAFIAKFNTNGVRQWATYYGGNGDDYGYGIASDSNGNIIVSGYTTSTNAIATTGAHQTIHAGNKDAFVVKFNSNGVRLWGTYYGGANNDSGDGIAIDAGGNIIILGETFSITGIATVGTHQTTYGGGPSFEGDAFIAKFNTNGVRLWATYYGGSNADWGNGITTDANGNIIITGVTSSTNAITTPSAHQAIFGGNSDAFIVKFNSSGVRQWATYYGGGTLDAGNGITTDASGDIMVTGSTFSSNAIATNGVHQTIKGGGWDAFIVKLTSSGMLPVKLIAFNAVLAHKKVNCTWETASEINNDYFTIERSVDGEDFEDVGTIKGRGNSSTNSHYHFTDNNPFEGISYYRLKQTDFDGKYTYSPIQKVGSTEQLDGEIALHYVNDNPIINIHAAAESIATLELIGLNG
ncbi:MAG: hypothetical protein EAY81_10345, partial [Bacteroidetes bacterium]